MKFPDPSTAPALWVTVLIWTSMAALLLYLALIWCKITAHRLLMGWAFRTYKSMGFLMQIHKMERAINNFKRHASMDLIKDTRNTMAMLEVEFIKWTVQYQYETPRSILRTFLWTKLRVVDGRHRSTWPQPILNNINSNSNSNNGHKIQGTGLVGKYKRTYPINTLVFSIICNLTIIIYAIL